MVDGMDAARALVDAVLDGRMPSGTPGGAKNGC